MLFCRRWSFHLNPALTWEDVSDETKVRLKDLVVEVVSGAALGGSAEWLRVCCGVCGRGGGGACRHPGLVENSMNSKGDSTNCFRSRLYMPCSTCLETMVCAHCGAAGELCPLPVPASQVHSL
jgi:hypothetical protein